MKKLIFVLLYFITFNVHAALISSDWKAANDNLVTIDTNSGLEWLDLTVTRDRTPHDISNKFGVGQEFEGWRYATTAEVASLWNAAGGDDNYYNGFSTANNGVFDTLSAYVGDLLCESIGCATGEGSSLFITADFDIDDRILSLAWDNSRDSDSSTEDFFRLEHALFITEFQHNHAAGSALVRITAVPIPATIWLFISGIISITVLTKRKQFH